MEKIDVEQVSFAGGDEAPPAEIVEGFKERAGANTGFILTIDGDASSSLRLAKDGKVSTCLSRVGCTALTVDIQTVLHPQPANDDRDPLNWPTWKKHTILMTISWGAFCADFTAAAGSATVVSQAAEWNKSLGRLNETNSINVLMM